MKKIITSIILVAIVGTFSFFMFKNKDQKLTKVKVADATISACRLTIIKK